MTDIALIATIRAAAPFQKLRPNNGTLMTITANDFRKKVREKRIGNTLLFVVDASGSMGAQQRMKAVKGALLSMLQDAYQKRDSVGMIAFRNKNADIILDITRSVDLAQKKPKRITNRWKNTTRTWVIRKF
ncbi:MAG: VWA domain-containing protein [Bacillaceae bacterium]|nr:VWA domain-containing protein [Bacillaceae bacterium]